MVEGESLDGGGADRVGGVVRVPLQDQARPGVSYAFTKDSIENAHENGEARRSGRLLARLVEVNPRVEAAGEVDSRALERARRRGILAEVLKLEDGAHGRDQDRVGEAVAVAAVEADADRKSVV